MRFRTIEVTAHAAYCNRVAVKQVRTVTLDPREQGRRRGSLWAYGYSTLAEIFGVTEESVRRWASRGELKPGDLGDVIRFARGRRRVP